MLTDTLRRERAASATYALLLGAGAQLTWRAHWDTRRDHTPDLGPLAVRWTNRAAVLRRAQRLEASAPKLTASAL